MATTNGGAYTQFDNPNASPPRYHTNNGPNTDRANLATDQDTKTLKKWKNSRRLCWAMLVIAVITVVLQIAGAIVSGTQLDWLLARFIAGVWLALLGVISAALGLRAFRNPFESSKCWSMTHFIMGIIATVAYGVLMLMAAAGTYSARQALEAVYDVMIDEQESEEESGVEGDTEIPSNGTSAMMINANDTTTSMPTETLDYTPLLHAIKGDITINVLLIGTTMAFFILGIIANVVICLNWFRRSGQKSMTIVYMPQDQSGNIQPQSVVLPGNSKSPVIVVPPPKPASA